MNKLLKPIFTSCTRYYAALEDCHVPVNECSCSLQFHWFSITSWLDDSEWIRIILLILRPSLDSPRCHNLAAAAAAVALMLKLSLVTAAVGLNNGCPFSFKPPKTVHPRLHTRQVHQQLYETNDFCTKPRCVRGQKKTKTHFFRKRSSAFARTQPVMQTLGAN